nr:hypothetical protein [Tanacetum cinerariifolium]
MRGKGRVTENDLDVVIQIISLAIVQNHLATKIKRPSLEVLGVIAKMTPKTKLTMKLVSWLNRQIRDLLEKEVLELNEKIKKLKRSKEIDIACKLCQELILENARINETQAKFVKFDKSANSLRERLDNKKSSSCKVVLGFDNNKASTSGTKPIFFVGSSAEKAMDGSTIQVHGSTLHGSVSRTNGEKLTEHVFSPPMSSRLDFVITRKKLIHNRIDESKKPSLKPSLKSGIGLQIKQMEYGIFFNKSKYIKEMLKKFGLEDSKPTKMPMSTEIKLTKDDEADSVDSSKYQGIETIVYADSNHAGDYVDRKSTCGVYTFMGCCLTSWFAKKKTAFAISTIEAEYVFAGKACQQALWMKQAIIDYDICLDDVSIISSKTNSPNFKRKTARMSVKYPTYVNLTSSSEEQPNVRTPSPPPRKKSLSLPQAPSKSISSKSTHYTSSSSPTPPTDPPNTRDGSSLWWILRKNMVHAYHKEVSKATTSKHVETIESDADNVSGDDDTSSSSEDLNFRGSQEKKICTKCDNSQKSELNWIVSTRWITAIEGDFHTSGCEDKTKVNFATNFRLGIVLRYGGMEKFMRMEFHSLLEINETVNEPWKKFNDMVLYCSEYLGNEKLNVDKFQRMLKDEIREVISLLKYTTLEDLLGRASIREADLIRKKNYKKKDLKRKQDQIASFRKGARFDQVKTGNVGRIVPRCNRCGHKLNECPKANVIEATQIKSIKEEKVKAPKAKARAYPMTAEEANEKLSTPLNKLLKPLEVEIADSKFVSVTNVYRDVDIEIDDSVFKIDLIPIMLREFNIVIGMDWLNKHNATILCSQKIIQVVNPNGREIILNGEKRKGEMVLCFVMKARKYLTRGCHAFLAHVIDTSFEKNKIENVLIVNEFGDVFPKDLQVIPPERHVELCIDPISGATPIAKTSYHLASSEMKELMSQLQELLDKGFIRPSSSPWGAPILFVKRKRVVCGCVLITVS